MAGNRVNSSGRDTAQIIRTKIMSIFMNLVLIIFSLSCIFPLVWMLYSSLKEKRVFNADVMGLPKNPSFKNYIDIFTNKDYHIFESVINSLRTTLISVFLIVIFGFIIGYILARIKFPGNRLLYIIFLMGMLVC
ncbi:MAG: hypothetical protein WCD89_22910 [Anaerocolumna sp.]